MIRGEVPSADGIADEEVAGGGQVLGRSPITVPGRFISNSEVAQEEEVYTKSTTGAGVEVGVLATKERGVKAVDLPFKIAESAGWFRGDDCLDFLESLPVAGEGVEKRQCND